MYVRQLATPLKSLIIVYVCRVSFVLQEKHMVVWVEAAILDDEALLKDKKFQKIKDKLVTFKYAYHILFLSLNWLLYVQDQIN